MVAVAIMKETTENQQASTNVSTTNMNCSASISGQSSYSNITNHSNQCNQDVGVPIIVERSIHIRNNSSRSSDVIEQVEGQVLKNNNCSKSIEDKIKGGNNSCNDKICYSERLNLSDGDNDETYYDVLTQQKAFLDITPTNGLHRTGGKESNKNSNRNKYFPHFYSTENRQILDSDIKYSSSLVLPTENHMSLTPPDAHHVNAEEINCSLQPTSCTSIADSKIATGDGMRAHQNQSEYSFQLESLPSKYTNPKLYESMEMNHGISPQSEGLNPFNKLSSSPYNPSMYESSSRARHSGIPHSPSTSPSKVVDEMNCPDERGLTKNHAQEQKLKPNHHVYPQSPSNDIDQRLSLQEQENLLSAETKERGCHYPLAQNTINGERIDDNNIRTIKSGNED